MNTILAKVSPDGQLHIDAAGYAPGTIVEVTITPAAAEASPLLSDASRELLSRLDKARNTAPVGPLHREEI